MIKSEHINTLKINIYVKFHNMYVETTQILGI